MKRIAFLSILLAGTAAYAATTKASSVTSSYITWTFDKEYEVGQFVNGDWYVVGPAKIIAIDNSLSDKSYMPEGEDVHGAMINPSVASTGPWERQQGESPIPYNARIMVQGYDSRIEYYNPELNAAIPNDKPLSKDNPLEIKPDQSLVSMVSWLWRSQTEKEAGCPPPPPPGPKKGYARPTMRTGAVLTCLKEAPPEGTFRPTYAGDKKKLHNIKDIKRDRLLNLAPVEGINAEQREGVSDELALYASYNLGHLTRDQYNTPANIPLLIRATSRAWINHIPQWWGSTIFNPAINVPNYGRESSGILQCAMLALHLDWSKIEGAPKTKDELLVNTVQIGIDLAGCAETGTHWQSAGGNSPGRMPIILFAALLLDDEEMKTIPVRLARQFQEKVATSYLSEERVNHTRSERWEPDMRGIHITPYCKEMVGIPEWGGNNGGWNVAYRDIFLSCATGFALVFNMMEDGRKHFDKQDYFDYVDRAHGRIYEEVKNLSPNVPPTFVRNMWDAYRANYPSTYDAKKWDTESIVTWCTTPGFLLKPVNRKGQMSNDLKLDEDPVRISIGHEVDLSGLTPKTVFVTANSEPVPVEAIDFSDKLGEEFVIRFKDGVLKKGTTYNVVLDDAVSGKWRNSIDLPLLSNKVSFKVQ